MQYLNYCLRPCGSMRDLRILSYKRFVRWLYITVIHLYFLLLDWFWSRRRVNHWFYGQVSVESGSFHLSSNPMNWERCSIIIFHFTQSPVTPLDLTKTVLMRVRYPTQESWNWIRSPSANFPTRRFPSLCNIFPENNIAWQFVNSRTHEKVNFVGQCFAQSWVEAVQTS